MIHKTILEKLEGKGQIIIHDKDNGDYGIYVTPQNIEWVRNFLDIELGCGNYSVEYHRGGEYYDIDFNIYEVPSYRKDKEKEKN